MRAVRWAVERLEPRRLLTTLHGGDTLVFQNEDGNLETVAAFGNITAEVIGANVDGNNNLILENLPGLLDGANTNGGLAIPGGASLVGPIVVNLPSMAPLVIPPADLAVDPNTGELWAIAIQTIPAAMAGGTATNAAYLIQIDKTTGTQIGMAIDVSQEILAASGIPPGTPMAEVTAVPAAAFNPTNGLMYFTAQTGVATAGVAAPGGTETLMTIDVNNVNPMNTVSAIPGNINGQIVSAFTFNGNSIVAASGMNVFTVNTLNTNITSAPVAAVVNAKITGLAQVGGKLFAITSSLAMSEVYVINPVNGTSVDYGPLPDSVVNPQMGQNPGGLTYDPTTQTLFSDDLQTKQLFTVSQVNRTRHLSVFQIYVSSSDTSGQIFESQSNQAAAMTPFGAGISGLNVINAQTGMLNMIPSPLNSGDGLIGARTRVIAPGAVAASNIPIVTGNTPIDFGVAPYAVGTTITAGIVSAAGTNIGTIALSGALMGNVNLLGGIDTMFVGWLLTGDTNGEPAQNVIDDPGNFSVAGDIRNLLVGASIGTDSDKALNLPTYLTGFDMVVGGTIGQVQTFDSLIGQINAQQSPSAPQLGTNQSEVEIRDVRNPFPWSSGELTKMPAFFYNDTFATAQALGAIPVAANGVPAQVVLDGTLQANAIQQDKVDYYSVALLAGQTVTCQVVPTAPGPPIDLGVFNPDGTEIATDYNSTDQGATENQFFRFTADRPGQYRFAVADNGNSTFVSTYGVLPGVTPYQLTIQGVGDLAVGAILAANNIFDNVDPTKPEPSFGAVTGDIGAIDATSDIFSTNGGSTAVVDNGSLRDVTGGIVGLLNGGAPIDDPEIQVPNGNVGLVDATNPAGTLFFNYPLPAPVVPPAIGGSYQLITTNSDMDVKAVANGSIGVIRGANIQVDANFPGPAQFFVNHDSSSVPGYIDLIDSAGGVGSAALGGPHIQTGPQGNVGYFRAVGPVFGDSTFGAAAPQETVYQPNETATLTDDSGATVTITPTGTPSVPPTVGSTNPTTGTTVASGTATGGSVTMIGLATNTPGDIIGDTITLVSGPGTGDTSTITAFAGGVATVAPAFATAPTNQTTYSIAQLPVVNPLSPQLSITAYGIEGSGGVAIMQIVSTGGVTITGTGDVPGQTVQIGEIDALGLGQGLVQTIGKVSTSTQPLPPPSSTSGSTTSTTSGTASTTGGTTSGTTAAPTYFTGADTAGPRGRTQPLPQAPMLNPNSLTPLDVILQGSARMGVFEVFGGDLSSIQNNSVGGEIVNTIVQSVGELTSGGTIGVTQNHTGAVLNGIPNSGGVSGDNGLMNTTPLRGAVYPPSAPVTGIGLFPFSDDFNAVVEEETLPPRNFTLLDPSNLSGTTANPFTPKLGPVLTVPTVISQTQPNGTTLSTTLIPIPVGPAELGIATVSATTGVGGLDVLGMPGVPVGSPMLGNIGALKAAILGPCFVDGSINSVVLGSLGVSPSGSGAVTQAGLYAMGEIGPISNSAPCDIRGNIVSIIGLTGISLKHGSIINATIGELRFLSQSTDISPTHDPAAEVTPITNPVLDVGNIILTGNGGIVGTAFRGEHFGDIAVIKGFGIFESVFNTVSGANAGDATIAEIVADGYGIRDVTVEGGASIGKIVATGHGTNVSTQVYSPDVRFSEVDTYDPFFGLAPGVLTDIDVMTGATHAVPQVPGAPGTGTDTGVIDTSYFSGSRDLTSVKAYQIRTPSTLPPTSFDFADSIGTITTLSDVNGMSVTTGRLATFHPGGNLSNMTMTISGRIGNLTLNGNVMGSSSINAVGINGNIGTLVVKGDMQGSITATRRITNATINGNLTGNVNAPQINTLKINGIINGGNLNVNGNVNSLLVKGDLGLPGETLTIQGSAKIIRIGGDLNANLTVTGSLGTLQVGGSIISGNVVDISGVLNLLRVGADIQAGATVTASVIKKVKVRGVIDGVVS